MMSIVYFVVYIHLFGGHTECFKPTNEVLEQINSVIR